MTIRAIHSFGPRPGEYVSGIATDISATFRRAMAARVKTCHECQRTYDGAEPGAGYLPLRGECCGVCMANPE